MIRETNMASAVGAKTARACDICVKKRARWYCAADDAFLCQSCDDSVHSANPLAKRHERIRIKSGSMVTRSSEAACLPTWHRGPTKKLRTPRHGRKKKHHSNKNNHLVVPELDASTSMDDEQEEEQLLYRVPVYEYDLDHHYPASCEVLLSDFDLADFDADVEAILGKGLDGDQNCGIEELGLLMDSHGQRDDYFVKVEKEEDRVEEIEVLREPFELSFDYDSPFACDDGDVKVVVNTGIHQEKKMILNLDYDSISMAWGTQGSPWMNGKRPDFNPNDDRWPLSTTGDCGTDTKGYGEVGLIIGAARGDKGGREARVSRYREKRRTRLFSKKIRYEVRKLNAEKRPRMKGRFVKRSSLIAK